MAHPVAIEVFYDHPYLGEKKFGGTGRGKWILEANDSQSMAFLEMLRVHFAAKGADGSIVTATQDSARRLTLS